MNVYQVTSEKDIDEWRLMQQFHEHTQTISAIDWALDDKIITASHDRSVFVWTKQANQDHWTKMLANIDIKLSIMCAKWSMSSKKFALGSACNTLAIGCFSF